MFSHKYVWQLFRKPLASARSPLKSLGARIFLSEGLGFVVVLAIAVIGVVCGGMTGVGTHGGSIFWVSEVDAVEGFSGVPLAHWSLRTRDNLSRGYPSVSSV